MFPALGGCRQSYQWAKRNMFDFRSFTVASPSNKTLCSRLSADVVSPTNGQSETCLILGVSLWRVLRRKLSVPGSRWMSSVLPWSKSETCLILEFPNAESFGGSLAFPAPGGCRSCHWAKRNMLNFRSCRCRVLRRKLGVPCSRETCLILGVADAESFGGSFVFPAPCKCRQSCHGAKRNMFDFRSCRCRVLRRKPCVPGPRQMS